VRNKQQNKIVCTGGAFREGKLTLGELGFVKKEKGKEYFAYVSS
jgi:hypothetical protein